jgi:hypothetical protein
VAENILEEQFKHTLRAYWRRMDPNVPPEVDDGSYEDMKTGKIDDKDKVLQYIGTLGLQIFISCHLQEDDPHNMEQKYYRYGIKPEWMQV